jgi:hypothetical protein
LSIAAPALWHGGSSPEQPDSGFARTSVQVGVVVQPPPAPVAPLPEDDALPLAPEEDPLLELAAPAPAPLLLDEVAPAPVPDELDDPDDAAPDPQAARATTRQSPPNATTDPEDPEHHAVARMNRS